MLEKFGLSSYENKVYLKLLELDALNARSISSQSGVPYGRIYDVLDSLVTNQLVIENKGRPKTYRAIDPDIAVSKLLENQKRKYTELKKQAVTTIQKLRPIYDSTPRDKLMWKVAIGDELYPDYTNFVSEAKREFLGYVEVPENQSLHNSNDNMDFYSTIISNLIRNNVKVKILLGIESQAILEHSITQDTRLKALIQSIEVRTSPIITHPFTVLDKEKLILKIVNPSNQDEMIAGLYIWDKKLAKTMRDQFLSIWENAKEISVGIEA